MAFAPVELENRHMGSGADDEEEHEDSGDRYINIDIRPATSTLGGWGIWRARRSLLLTRVSALWTSTMSLTRGFAAMSLTIGGSMNAIGDTQPQRAAPEVTGPKNNSKQDQIRITSI